jgi:ubiquinone/menaquinone biosynthesis C-methylase UbiE
MIKKEPTEYSKEAVTDFYSYGKEYKVYTSNYSFREGEEYIYDNYFDKEKSLLDIGCGGGRTTFLIYNLFRETIGLDINERLIHFAQEKARTEDIPLNFIVGDATQLCFPDNEFDNILFSYNGIEGIPSRQARLMCLKEIYRVLKPNGVFIFTTHTLFSRVYLGFHIKKLINLITKHAPFIPTLYSEFTQLKLGDIFVSNRDNVKMAWHLTNPFHMMLKLRNTGFEIVYINNCERISKRKMKSTYTSFLGTHCVFYIVRKSKRFL